MTTLDQQTNSTEAERPHRPLPPLGLPVKGEGRRAGVVVSVLLHALIIGLLLVPFAMQHGTIIERAQGAGGAGPAGGGGGGRGGTGGAMIREQLQYIELAPTPVPTPVAVPPPEKPVPKPVPTPVPPVEKVIPEPVPPPEPVPEKVQEPAAPATNQNPDTTASVAVAASKTPGVGGGSGNDGTAGNGPGSGGGVGSGVGTGRGSGTGPGTGGGRQENYPPTPTEVFIPPLPMPDEVRGFHLVAEYDVDATGHIVSFDFTPTRNRGYNKRLEEVLRSFRFRPGTRPDGTPIRMKAQIIYDF